MMRRGPGARDERGAAAVEFAIVATLLVTLLLGIIEFGYLFFMQGTLAGAAREGVREYAIHKDATAATGVAVDAGSTIDVTSGMVAITAPCPAAPPAGVTPAATMTITFPGAHLTGFFGSFTLTGTGTMRCNG